MEDESLSAKAKVEIILAGKSSVCKTIQEKRELC